MNKELFRRIVGGSAANAAREKLAERDDSSGSSEREDKSGDSDERSCMDCGQPLDGVLGARCYDCASR